MRWLAAIPASVLLASSLAAHSAEGCDAFTWDVSRQRALLQQPATSLLAAKSARIELDTHYTVRLTPQKQTQLAAAPEKSRGDDSSHAGVVRFRVPKTGRYRIAISTNHWLDVVDGSALVKSTGFQGQKGCDRPHKVVEFDLPAGKDLILQFSGGTLADVGLVITAAPSL